LEKNYEDLEWCRKLHSDKADKHQLVGEQNGLNKTIAPRIPENTASCRIWCSDSGGYEEFYLLVYNAM
jgi:hypothetical protein